MAARALARAAVEATSARAEAETQSAAAPAAQNYP